jgi:hypothetical protein
LAVQARTPIDQRNRAAEADELEAGPQHLRSDDGKFPPE